MGTIDAKTRSGQITRLLYSGKDKGQVLDMTAGSIHGDAISFPVCESLVSNIQRTIPSVQLTPIVREWYERRMSEAVSVMMARREMTEEQLFRWFMESTRSFILLSPFGIGEHDLVSQYRCGDDTLVITETHWHRLYKEMICLDRDGCFTGSGNSVIKYAKTVVIDLPLLTRDDPMVHLLKQTNMLGKKLIFIVRPEIWTKPEAMWVYLNILNPYRFSSLSNYVKRFTLYESTNKGRVFYGMQNEEELSEIIALNTVIFTREGFMSHSTYHELGVTICEDHQRLMNEFKPYQLPEEGRQGLLVSPADMMQYPYQPLTPLVVDIAERILASDEQLLIICPYKEYGFLLGKSLNVLTPDVGVDNELFRAALIEDFSERRLKIFIVRELRDCHQLVNVIDMSRKLPPVSKQMSWWSLIVEEVNR